MRTTTKILGAGLAAVAVGILGAQAFAQQGPGFGPGHMGMGSGMMKGHGMGPMMGRGQGTFGDPAARLATAKTEIGIKPEQQAAWDSYAKVVTDTATAARGQRETVSPDTIFKMDAKERQAFITKMQEQRQQNFKTVSAAAETLLAQLDDSQKAKAREVLPGLAAAGHGPGAGHGMAGGPGMGRGMGHGPGHGMGPPWMR
ncbi:MAG: Spy/CpxP family protein refolding chaperone [Parvibaculaceae bacterium]